MNIKKSGSVLKLVTYVLLSILAIYTLFPFILALVNSFKTNQEMLINIMSFPKKLHFENYRRSLEKMRYPHSLSNTIFLGSLAVALIVLFSAMAGWRLCRTKSRLSGVIFSFFVFSMLIPFSSIMIPLYKVVLALNIKNSLVGLSFVYSGMGVSMAIFLYHGFVKGVPKELEEAASIDGCNSLQIFFGIVFPLLKSITSTICITNMLWIWNDFLLPLIVLSNKKKYTLLLSTNTLFGQYSSDWAAILSALILAALPVIIFYAFFQKQILQGITESAVKG